MTSSNTHSDTNGKSNGNSQPSGGPAVDRTGTPVVDPSRNVLDLVDAAIKRQDDLRESESAHIREIVVLRAEERAKEIDNVKEFAALRASHENQLREAEAKRIDAIRAVDVGAVVAAAAVQTTQASTLAAQVATSAEALRNQVAAVASAQTVALAAALEPIIKDIADLRRAQYEAQGQKINVVDTQAANTGQRQASNLTVAMIVGAIGVLSTIITLVFLIGRR